MYNTKKILLSLLLIISFFSLNSCWEENNNTNSKNITNSSSEWKYSKISSISCDERLEECGDTYENKNIDNILKINDTVCDLTTNINSDKYEDIFVDFDNKKDKISSIELSEKNWIKDLSFTIEKNNNSEENKWNIFNIMFDLTYFSGNKDVEKDVFENRKKILKDFITNWIWENKIDYNDKINLFYIWTSDYWEQSKWFKNHAITDKNNFLLKKNSNSLSGKYNIKYSCDKNNRKRKLVMYYHSSGKEEVTIENNNSNIQSVSDINSLESEVLKVIEEKYNSWKYNKWTYLLESLSKNKDFINKKESINILISDMFFQLHPDMKKNKNLSWNSFDFNKENILKIWENKDFTDFYENTIPKYLEEKCNSWEKLYLFWIELSDNLDVKMNMKKYYKEKFFKWCEVDFR